MSKRKNNFKKQSFTLLEILIALLILSTALTGIGLKGAKLIRGERFERAMEIFSDHIDFAYEILLLYQTDFTLILEKKSNEVFLSYLIEGADSNFAKKIARPQIIKGIEKMIVNGEELSLLTLHFSKDNGSYEKKVIFAMGSKKRLFTVKGAL